MQFVISAASKSSDVQLLLQTFARQGGTPNHVRGVLVTPLLCTQLSLTLSRRLQEEFNTSIMFDSGGYGVQTGRIDYYDMYSLLLDLYRRERWAQIYTLPDNVPTSRDTPAEVDVKVRQTVECSELFFREMPRELRERALGVVHGRTTYHLEYCLEHYLRLGLRHVGFGSFGTAGQNSSMNIVTADALVNARALTQLALSHKLSVHLFGIGSPAILPWIAQTGATSFDSANWAKSAGFGQVFLPLTRGYNVSHQSGVSTIQQGLTRVGFQQLREISGHTCDYCRSFERLQSSREARAAHNIYATVDTLGIISRRDIDIMAAVYSAGSPRYRTLWSRGGIAV